MHTFSDVQDEAGEKQSDEDPEVDVDYRTVVGGGAGAVGAVAAAGGRETAMHY